MGTDSEGAGDTPRWRDLGDSRDLAAAVRSAYESSPRERGTASTADPALPAEAVDALALLRAGSAPSRPAVAPRRVLAVVGGAVLVVAAAIAPVAVLTRGPAGPSMTPMDGPTGNPGAATPTTATPEPWTYEPAPPTTVAVQTTTSAPSTATTAVARTATTTRARRSPTTRASSAPTAPASSPPATDPPPADDEPTSGW